MIKISIVAFIGAVLLATSLVSLLLLYLICKECKKSMREAKDKIGMDWASALAAVERGRDKESDAKDRLIASLQDLLVEKDERIEQLENDIALKGFIMKCAKVDGTFDEKKLQDMIDHIKVGPFVENVVG